MSTWGAQQQSQQRAELLGQPRSAPVSAQQQQQQVATSQGQSSAASRAIASLSRAVDHGRVTVEELDAQGEQIEGAIRQMDRIHGVLNTSEITLTELEKSWAFSTPAITLQDGHVLKVLLLAPQLPSSCKESSVSMTFFISIAHKEWYSETRACRLFGKEI